MHGASVLIAVDGSLAARTVLEEVVRGVGARGRITVVRVITEAETWWANISGVALPHFDVNQEAANWLHQCVADLPPDLSITWMVRRGNRAAKELADLASVLGCQTIIVAGAGRTRRLGRSIGERVRRCSELPVLELAPGQGITGLLPAS